MQQKRQSVAKTKMEMNSLRSLVADMKPKSRSKTSGSKIKVVVRKRPVNEMEKRRKDSDIITVKDNCTLYIDEPRCKVDMTKYNERHEFIVDKVFNEDVDNYTVYVNTIKPLLVDVFKNNCVCSCFAYGQTGSGKTYTMLGSQPYGQSNTPGIFQYAAHDIFDFLKVYDVENRKGIFISFYEIYCGKLYDLLQNRKMVAALENGKKEVVVKDLKVLRVLTKEELVAKMVEGVLLRKIGVNSQNDESSRSHAILNIDLKDVHKNSSLGKIAFIDLAGSERGADTIAQNKQTQTDGANINRSLLALKECIRAMDAEKSHIPFRDSELTKVLRDIFVGKSKSIMIANISPTISCCEQTLNTLRYSSRVKNFKNKATVNEEEDSNENKPLKIESKMSEFEQSGTNLGYNNRSSVSITVEGKNTVSNNMEQSKLNIKMNESKLKSSKSKNRNLEKGRDSATLGKSSTLVEQDNKTKRKKKYSVGNNEKNMYNFEYAAKKHNIAQPNYTFTDTSDFSSIDEMNCNLNNNDHNIYMNNRNTAVTLNRVKNRSSCGSNVPAKEKRNVDLMARHSVEERFYKYSSVDEIERSRKLGNGRLKDSSHSIIKNQSIYDVLDRVYLNEDENSNIRNNDMNNNINNNVINNNDNTNNNVLNNSVLNNNNNNKVKSGNNVYISHIGSTANCNSYKMENISGGLKDTLHTMDSVHNNMNEQGNGNVSGYSHHLDIYSSEGLNYDYNQLDKNSLLNFQIGPEKLGSLRKEYVEGNNSDYGHGHGHGHGHDLVNNLSSINTMNSLYGANSAYNINSNSIVSSSSHLNMNNDGANNIINEFSSGDAKSNTNMNANTSANINANISATVINEKGTKYANWKIEQNYNYENSSSLIQKAGSGMINVEDANTMGPNKNSVDSINGFISMNEMLRHCLDSQNISNYLSEETKQILNVILLSKHYVDKDSLIKNYICGDIANMSIEDLNSCCQKVSETRQTALNTLLAVYRKNVNTQTNPETSDLKQDLYMCHLCEDHPDDKFHFYVSNRIDRDLTRSLMLKQIWCECENLRMLRQYLFLEYQKRVANPSCHIGNGNSASLNRSYIGNVKNEEQLNSKKNLL